MKYLIGEKLRVGLNIFRNQDFPKDKLNTKHPFGTELLCALESLAHP